MKYSKLIIFTIVALVFTDSLRYISWVEGINVENATYITALLNYISIAIIVFVGYKIYEGKEIPLSIKNWFKFWLLWIIFNLLRGALLCTDYWDWKFLLLESFAFSLIPLMFFWGQNLEAVKLIFKFFLYFLFPFGFLLIPLTFVTNAELYSRIMIPISLFIIFIPYLKFKWKLLIILVAVTSILMVLDFRSNFLKISFSVFILPLYYFRKILKVNWFRAIHIILFALPLVFFILAVTDTFNLFQKTSEGNEGYTTTDKEGEEVELMGDTRTFLYVEVIASLNNSGHLLFGESASGKYKTEYFELQNGLRYGSEVGILNILLYHGIIGVSIYFFLLLTVSYIAINKSQNTLARLLGLFIAFRWLFSFIEEFTQFDLNFYIFWITIGLVSSASFRNMNDEQIKNYLKLE